MILLIDINKNLKILDVDELDVLEGVVHVLHDGGAELICSIVEDLNGQRAFERVSDHPDGHIG